MTKKVMQGNFTLNVNFNLRQTTPANALTAINAVVRFNNQRVVVSGIDKVEPRYWNAEKQAPKQHSANARAREISRSLSDAKAKITEAFESYIAEYRQYPDNMKHFLQRCRSRVFNLPELSEKIPEKQNGSLIDYIDHFKTEMENGKKVISSGKSKGQAYAKNSSKGYTNLLFNLKAYQNYIGAKDIQFTDIDLDFYTDFRSYLVTERNLTPGYFGDLIKTLKSVMNDSYERGYHTNQKHKSRHFIKETSEADTVFLDKTKLATLLSFNFSDKPALDNARNLFLLGAYSGLRFSDFTNIKLENISEDYLRVRTQKTKDFLSIPISKELREVLSRYPNGIKAISNQRLNSFIKVACKEAGFTEMVSIRKFDKGKEIYATVPFYELVSSHTARRSWATNAFKSGYPTILIQAITGHKTESAFLKYIRMDNEDKSAMMLEMMRRNELKVVS